MQGMQLPLYALIGISILLAVLIVTRPALTQQRGGKVLAFLALFLLPGLTIWTAGSAQLEHSKTTQFCLSCHVMTPYGRSLHVDDSEYIPAVHYQNNWVPRKKACYTCHTDYALFGDVRSKLRGLRHLSVQYFGAIPDTVRLYTPFNNRECLHCHGGARKFEAQSAHTEGDTTMAAMVANRLSCLTSGCHDTVHDVHNPEGQTLWKEPTP